MGVSNFGSFGASGGRRGAARSGAQMTAAGMGLSKTDFTALTQLRAAVGLETPRESSTSFSKPTASLTPLSPSTVTALIGTGSFTPGYTSNREPAPAPTPTATPLPTTFVTPTVFTPPTGFTRTPGGSRYSNGASGGGTATVPATGGGTASTGSSGSSSSPPPSMAAYTGGSGTGALAASPQVAAAVTTISTPTSGSWTGSAAAYRAAQLEMDLSNEEDEAEDDDDDDDDMSGWGVATGVFLGPVGWLGMLTRKSKLKRRKNKRKHLLKKLEHAEKTGNPKKIARVQKHLAARRAHTLKVALRRHKHGKSLTHAEKRLLAHENAKIHSKKMVAHARRGLTYVPRPILPREIEAQATAYNNTARMSDDDVAQGMDTSPSALAATAVSDSAVEAAADSQEAAGGGGLFGMSWFMIGGIVLGLGVTGYVVKKGLKKKSGGGYSFDAGAIKTGIVRDFKGSAKTSEAA